MINPFEDDEDDPQLDWHRKGGKWVCKRGNKTLEVERVGWFPPRYRYRVIEAEGELPDASFAMKKAEILTEPCSAPKLRLLRGLKP